MDQQQQQPARPEDLVRRLKPWWGLAIAGLLGIGTMGGVLAIHYAGQVTQAKKNFSYQKADDSWIDHEPNRVAHAEVSSAPASPSPTPLDAVTPMPQYQPSTQNYVPSTLPDPATERRRQEYEKALASDLLVAPRGESQALETPRLVSAGGEPAEGQDSSLIQAAVPSSPTHIRHRPIPSPRAPLSTARSRPASTPTYPVTCWAASPWT